MILSPVLIPAAYDEMSGPVGVGLGGGLVVPAWAALGSFTVSGVVSRSTGTSSAEIAASSESNSPGSNDVLPEPDDSQSSDMVTSSEPFSWDSDAGLLGLCGFRLPEVEG